MAINLEKRVEAIREVRFGFWVPGVCASSYVTEAIDTDNRDKNENGYYVHSYHVNVSKEGKLWVVYAEDHDWEDIKEWCECDGDGFKTLADAKLGAEEFCRWFNECYHQNNDI